MLTELFFFLSIFSGICARLYSNHYYDRQLATIRFPWWKLVEVRKKASGTNAHGMVPTGCRLAHG